MLRTVPLLLSLAGCTWSDPLAVTRLARLSPTEVEFGAASVGVALPEGVGVLPGSARLFLGAERGDTGESVGSTAPLAERGGRWIVAPEEAAALRETQAAIRRWRAEAPDATRGTLSVTVGGCVEGAGPGPDPRVSVDLALEPGAAPLPLVRGAPLSAVVGDAALPPCRA
jgi:hypothetical protein